MATTQLQIDFEPGLTELYPDWWECVEVAVTAVGVRKKTIAGDLDYSPSEFSRRVSSEGDLPFPATKVEPLLAILAERGELRPILWLVEKYMEHSDIKEKRQRQEVYSLMRQLQDRLKQMEG